MTSWELILHIRNKIKDLKVYEDRITIDLKELAESDSGNNAGFPEKLTIYFHHIPLKILDSQTVCCPRPFRIKIDHIDFFPSQDQALLKMYLPYAVLPYFARKSKRTYVVSHFAQTLDGRIATLSGDSKWIGNKQNLIHAHRMRALMDGILIGAGTLKRDNPRLTVRHVTGKNPVKIIIGGDEIDFSAYRAVKSNALVFCTNHFKTKLNVPSYRLPRKMNRYDTSEILKKLYEAGISCLYLEGGARTTSAFLNQHNIDQVQIHFSPVILGSGLSGFNFDGAKILKEAVRFRSYRYQPSGDQVMFIGELMTKGNA